MIIYIILIIICDITTSLAAELLGVISPNPTVDEFTNEKYKPSTTPSLLEEKASTEMLDMNI